MSARPPIEVSGLSHSFGKGALLNARITQLNTVAKREPIKRRHWASGMERSTRRMNIEIVL